MKAPNGTHWTFGRATLGVLAAVALVGLPQAARAAGTISGTVLNGSGAGLGNIQVIAYRSTGKGYVPVSAVVTPAAGSFSIPNLADGTYKLLARLAPGVVMTTAPWTDRWYGDKSVEQLGTTVVIKGGNTVANLNITLSAGTWGQVRIYQPGGTTPVPTGMLCRAEDDTDSRVNHLTNQLVAPSTTGECVFLGLEAAASANGKYHLWLHDSQARYKDYWTATPMSAATNGSIGWPNATLTAIPPDPNEPNNSVSAGTNIGNAVDTNLRTYPAGTYTVTNGVILPGDVDVYCWTGQTGDRFIVTATTKTNLTGKTRYSPFVDPYLQVHGAIFGDIKNDDGGPGPLDARVDTGLLTTGQQVCAEVSTYNDSGLTGANQGSHGTYSLVVGMGNRPPVITQPVDASSVSVGEGLSFNIAINVTDPDTAKPTLKAVLKDKAGTVVSKGALTYDPTQCSGGTGAPFSCDGSWAWTTQILDSNGSPYSLALTADDGEFQTTNTVTLNVVKSNLPPTLPKQTAPANGSQVTTKKPALTVKNSTDPNGDPITYHFELYDTDPSTGGVTPLATYDVNNDPSGSTSANVTQTLTENATYWWRVEADDNTGGANATSGWTGYWTFMVNTVNDPPLAPTLTAPTDGSTVATVQPTLTVDNTTDPEGDPIDIFYEISTDPTFADPTKTVATSPGVPQVNGTNTTDWIVDAAQRLQYSTDYYARAYAEDNLKAKSGYSNINHFTTPTDSPPTDPSMGPPFDQTCSGLVITKAADIPSQIVVNNPTDPENDPLKLELQVYDATLDPTKPGFTPLIDTTVPMDASGSTTAIPVDGTKLAENGHYTFRVRADDGTKQSNWVSCDLYVNAVNSPPTAVHITVPKQPGMTFPATSTSVGITVTNASDPDYGIPGTTLADAYCASMKSDFSDCPAKDQWPTKAQGSGNPQDTTSFSVPVAPGDTWYVEVCAIDEHGATGPCDQTNFSILTASNSDGGTGDGGSGQKGTPGGCCTTARGGQPVMALWAALGLLLLIPRRRKDRG